MSCRLISPKAFHSCVQAMRDFCISKGFIEVHPQSALSILAACEDPRTVREFNYGGKTWPLPQTGQMWLEHVLLENPDFEVVSVYRQAIAMSQSQFLGDMKRSSLCLSSSSKEEWMN